MSIKVNPLYSEAPLIKLFESWIKKNYTGSYLPSPPKGVDLNEVFYYSMGGKQYGPIPYKKVPRTKEGLERKVHRLPKKKLRYDGELWNEDPNCEHEVEPSPGGGVKCTKCSGWFCY